MNRPSRRGFLAGASAFAVSGLAARVQAAMGPNDKFDLLITGGEVLDPSQGLRARRDVGIRRFVDTRNNKRAGKVHLRPAQAVLAGVPFGRPYPAPFSVR